jgi:hypothetical protein
MPGKMKSAQPDLSANSLRKSPLPHKLREPQELPKSKKSKEPLAKEDRSDRSILVGWVLVLVMGLLLINGWLYIQGFFTDLVNR